MDDKFAATFDCLVHVLHKSYVLMWFHAGVQTEAHRPWCSTNGKDFTWPLQDAGNFTGQIALKWDESVLETQLISNQSIMLGELIPKFSGNHAMNHDEPQSSKNKVFQLIHKYVAP